jgi:hypothetical protein
MTTAAIGVLVGVTVALASQIISYLFSIRKISRAEKKQKQALVRLLYYEIKSHKAFCEAFAVKIETTPRQRIGAYHTLRTDVYEKALFPNWHLLPEDLITPISWHYTCVYELNLSDILSRSTDKSELFQPDKDYLEGVANFSDDLIAKLKKLF